MGQQKPSRKRVIVWISSIAGGLVFLYLLGFAAAILFGIQVLPGPLLPWGGSEPVRPTPEVVVAQGLEAGHPWRLTANTVDGKPCMQSYVDERPSGGQCGFKDFPHSTNYSPSAALLGNQLVVHFGPVPPGTATVVLSLGDGTQRQVATQTDPASRVTYFCLAASQDARDFHLLDANGHEVPV